MRSKKSSKKIAENKPEPVDSENESEFETPKKSKGRKRKAKNTPGDKSRAQTAAKKLRGERGRIETLVEMPFDILCEVSTLIRRCSSVFI